MSLVQISMSRAFGFNLGKKNELSMVGAFIVYQCHFYRLRMKDIAEMNGVSRSTITQYVDNLEKKGYVRRVRGEKDRRDIYIEPTEKANAWVLETEQKIYAYMQGCLSRLTPEEHKQFIDLFNKFVGDTNVVPYDWLFEQAIKNDFRTPGGDRQARDRPVQGILTRREEK